MHTFSFPLANADYTVNSDALAVMVPAGAPQTRCIPVGIVDDEVALEGNETFQLFFASLEPGVVAADPSEVDVTIIDNDEGELIDLDYALQKKEKKI